jgi:hypothetical protein
MCTFAAMEPVLTANATTYTTAIMKIMLQFGFYHTCVLDKDSKFYGMCREALDFIKVNPHVLSSSNHNPMIIKCLNHYLNAGMRIIMIELDFTCIALKAILYMNCLVPSTDISRSMVAISREFAFLIDFSTGKHAELYLMPGTVESYSWDLAIHLSSCHEIADLLVWEHCCWHQDLVNSCQCNQRIFSVGNIMFAHRATRSNTKRGHVDKLMHPFTGPWRVIRALPGASYKLEFAHDTR